MKHFILVEVEVLRPAPVEANHDTVQQHFAEQVRSEIAQGLEDAHSSGSLPPATSVYSVELIAQDARAALATHSIYKRLHDILSDAIEGGRLTAAELPGEYAAIAQMLEAAAEAEAIALTE